jgi:hypothetical protein
MLLVKRYLGWVAMSPNGPEAAEMWCRSKSTPIWGTPAVVLTHSKSQPVTRSGVRQFAGKE